MANELENALKNTASKIAYYVDKIGTLEVSTYYTEVGAAGEAKPQLAASTTIKIDSDTSVTVPMRKSAAGALEVDSEIFAIHERNVASAMSYRAQMINALISGLRDLTKRN